MIQKLNVLQYIAQNKVLIPESVTLEMLLSAFL